LKGEDVSLKAQQVEIGATEVRSDFSGGAEDVRYETGYVKHLGSTIEGEKVAMVSPGSVTISGSEVKAEKDLTIAARQVNVLSVHDSSYDKLTNESKGLLSSYKSVDETRVSHAMASHLKAKHIRISADTMTMIGSSIEADSARITAGVLNLASDKNSTFERHFKDGSGLILRTISERGRIHDTAVASTIQAEKLIFNRRTLGGDSVHGEGDHHATSRDEGQTKLIAALSSEHNLNEAQINQLKAVLNSREWNHKTTTLSQTGSLIVQAVAAAITEGAGSALTSSITNAAVQAAVAAAVDSVAMQVTSQLMTAALTGEAPKLNVGRIARNAVMSGLVAGANFKMDAIIKKADLGKIGTAAARGVGHAVSAEAAYGGKFKDVLTRSLVSEASAAGFEYIGHNLYDNPRYKDMNLPPKVVVHALVGGTLAQISGGDFKSGAIATATAHVVAEYMIGSTYEDRAIKGEISSGEAKRQIRLIASTVAGAVTLMTNKNISAEALSVSTSLASSVVENNYLKGFDAYVAFGKGIIQGGGEKAWDDLKASGLALSSPLKTIEAIGALISSPEAMKGVEKDTYDGIVAKYNHVKEALTSAKAYGPDAGGAAGKDAGKLLLMIGETYGGVKGFVVAAKSAGRIIKFGKLAKKAKSGKTVDSILTGTHKYDEPNLNKRINQRADFSSGATHITSGKKLDRRVAAGKTETIGNPKQLYVSPTYQVDKLLNKKGVTKAEIKRNLGLGDKSLEKGSVTRFDISSPKKRNMRLPDPATGNQYHRPKTGLTVGGQTERTIHTPKLNDPGITRTDLNIPKGQ